MFMYAVKKPAAAAAAALGEDGTAVFCEGPGLLFASARGETPDAGITTAIFNDVEKGDIHDGDRWFPGAGSIAEVVFDMPAPLGEKLAGRLEDSAFLIDYFRDKIASLGEAREAGRVAELRRQGLICEDSATHAAATAAPNGIASGCPDDVAEARERSLSLTDPETQARGAKRAAGSSAQDEAAGRGPAL